MKLSLYIPNNDLEWLHSVAGTEERANVNLWKDILIEFEKANNKAASIQVLCNKYAGLAKITKSTLYRKANRVKKDGWVGLLNKKWLTAYLSDTNASSEFEEFIEQEWKPRCNESQRVTAASYRQLMLDLTNNKIIKGYNKDWRGIWLMDHKHTGMRCPSICPYHIDRSYPRGWSRRNLYRLAPDQHDRAAARIGTAAAKKYLPSIPTTRVGLPFARIIQIDDVHHDVKVRIPGNREPEIVVELRALELLSGKIYSTAMKPVIRRKNNTREMLREDFTRYLLADILVNKGFNPDGLLICGERGTAKLSDGLMETVQKWGGDRIEFMAGGIADSPLSKGLLGGPGKGNPQFKAAIESVHSLMKNELALLPGQKGADPVHSPETHIKAVRHDKHLLKICNALIRDRPQLCEQLIGMFPPYYQYIEAINYIYNRIDNRTDHHLEGFHERGFVKSMWRLHSGDSWKPESMLQEMDPEDAENIKSIIRRNPVKHSILTVMSPAEAEKYCKANTELIYLPKVAVPEILGPTLGEILPVEKNNEILVSDKYIPDRVYPISPVVRTLDGRKELLPAKSKWLVHLNPYDIREAYISHLDGRFIGVAPAIIGGSRIDKDAYIRNQKIVNSVIYLKSKSLSKTAENRLEEMYENSVQDVETITGRNPVHDIQENEDNHTEIMQYDLNDNDMAAAGSGHAEYDDDEAMDLNEIAEMLKQ